MDRITILITILITSKKKKTMATTTRADGKTAVTTAYTAPIPNNGDWIDKDTHKDRFLALWDETRLSSDILVDKTADPNILLDNLEGNAYNISGAAKTGNLTIDLTGILLGGVSIMKHNDASVPTVSASTATIIFPIPGVAAMADMYTTGADNYLKFVCIDATPSAEIITATPWAGSPDTGSVVSFVDNLNGTFTITIDSVPTGFDANTAAAPVVSTLPIEFDALGLRTYGTPDVPLSGSLSGQFDMTGAVDGARSKMWYQDATDPFDPFPSVAGWELRKSGGQLFVPNILIEYEFVVQLASNTILIQPSRQDTSPPTISNIAVTNSAPPADATAMVGSFDYAQAESVAQNTAASIMEVWQAATAGELDVVDIEAGTPTLRATQTGNLQWTPDTEAVFLRFRFRAYSADPSAPGSAWGYSSVFGPVAAAGGFDPLSLGASLKLWYDFSDPAGGTVGTLADHWQFVINKADGSGDSDYNQASTANQIDISNQVADDAAETPGANCRYEATSWALAGDMIADNANRRFYIVCKVPDGVVGEQRIAYFGGTVWLRTEAGHDYVKVASGALVTPTDSIDGTKWLCIRFEYDGVDSMIDILAGNGIGGSSASQNTKFALGFAVNNSLTNSFDIDCQYSLALIKHIMITDSSETAQQQTDLEDFLIAEAV